MDVNAIAALVSSVGFPIVACGALFWKMNKDNEQRTAESNKLSEAINNNTLAMTRLLDKIDAK
jgi:hypothetical protein